MDLVAAQTILKNYKGAEANPTRRQTAPSASELLFAQNARDKAAATSGNQQ